MGQATQKRVSQVNFSGAFINYPFRRKRGWYQKNVGICQWFLRRWPVVITNVQLDTGTWFITNSKSSINLQKYYEEVRNPENSKAWKKKKKLQGTTKSHFGLRSGSEAHESTGLPFVANGVTKRTEKSRTMNAYFLYHEWSSSPPLPRKPSKTKNLK